MTNLPKPEYRFPDNNTGSDVTAILRVRKSCLTTKNLQIQMFLNKKPICGATILLALKRNSHETEMADILQLVQKHHVMIYTAASDEMIGGSDSSHMYNLVSKSNGVFIFNSDDRQGAVSEANRSRMIIHSVFVQQFWSPYGIWACLLYHFSCERTRIITTANIYLARWR